MSNASQIIITADDFGLTRGITDTILETVDKGPVTNVSVMPNGDAFDYAIQEYLKRKEKLSLSVHLNLTEGKPLSKPDEVPLLVGRDGMFKHSVGGLLFSYFMSFSKKKYRQQIRTELNSQIRRVSDAIQENGNVVSVNGHQHVHMLPFVFDELIALTNLPPVRIPHELAYVPSFSAALSSWRNVAGWPVLAVLCARARGRVRAFNAHFIGFLYSGRMTLSILRSALLRITPMSSNVPLEILFHPGSAADNELRSWQEGNADVGWHHSLWREKEKALLLNGSTGKLLEDFKNRTLSGQAMDPLKILRFLISGTLAALTHLGFLYLLTEYAGVWYVFSSAIGWGGGFVVSFTLQKYWTFANHSREFIGRQAALYFLLQGVNFIVNGAALFFLTDVIGLWYMLAQFVVLLVLAVWTYAISRRFIFVSSVGDSTKTP